MMTPSCWGAGRGTELLCLLIDIKELAAGFLRQTGTWGPADPLRAQGTLWLC